MGRLGMGSLGMAPNNLIQKMGTMALLFACGSSSGCSTSLGLSHPSLLSLATPAPNLKINLGALGQPNSATQPQSLGLSVRQFGAIGNGVIDDTKAIQATIDSVVKNGGGTIFFPAGTYKILIQPQASRALTIDKNVVLKGAGYQKSVIKLGDRQGNYSTILAGSSLDRDLSSFSLQHLTIDANAANNPTASEQSFKQNKDRFVLKIYAGRNIRVENCRFTNIKDINVLTINNDKLISDIVVQNNRFDGIGGGSFDHDHSTIYIHGKRSLIAQNTFTSSNGSGTYGARTAIEIHGDEHRVINNRISGYTYGINATGVASSSKNQRIEGNTITGAHTGILLWSYLLKGQQVEGQQVAPGLENLSIDRNQIEIDVAGWRKLWGNSPNQGIALEPDSNAPIKGLNITNNTIEFRNVKDAGKNSDTLAAGIVLWRYKTPQVGSENVAIAQNTIRNPLASGIYIAMPIQQLEIAQNNIFNAGQGQYPFHPHYRSGLIISLKSMSTTQIQKNQFMDDQPQPTMTAGMLWQGTCAQGCVQRENRLVVRASAKVPLLIQTP
jgi:Pectate lyase superfamily protein